MGGGGGSKLASLLHPGSAALSEELPTPQIFYRKWRQIKPRRAVARGRAIASSENFSTLGHV